MTTRQSHSASHRNTNYKVEPTVISGRKAIVVKLDWTTAPVVKTTIRTSFKLFVVARDTQTWLPVQRGSMILKAGQVVHFTASSNHPGYYYVTIVGESCTCTAGLYKQECHHQKDAVAFESRRFLALEDARREDAYRLRMAGHNARAAAQEYRIRQSEATGAFFPEYRCEAVGWTGFTSPTHDAASVVCETRDEAEAFLAQQPAIEAVAA